jgi:hypothetical protein
MPTPEPSEGWAWFDAEQPRPDATEAICRSAAFCLGSGHGHAVLRHLQLLFLDRRVPPTASDAELRHAEGQRSVVSHLLRLVERGRGTGGPTSSLQPDRDADL